MMMRLIAFVATLTGGTFALAQPLANKVPGDALIYIGWRGSADMGPGYEGSNLKGFLEASQLPQQIAEFLPQVARKLGEKDRSAAEKLRLVTAVAGPVWRHPSAFYFGGVDFTNPNQPKPKMALIVDAGDEARALLQQVQIYHRILCSQLPNYSRQQANNGNRGRPGNERRAKPIQLLPAIQHNLHRGQSD